MTDTAKPNNIFATLLSQLGWQLIIPNQIQEKSVICVAPHTSNTDFPLGLAYYRALGRRAHFLMKKELFAFPFGYFFRSLGGIPVDRSTNNATVEQVIRMIKEARGAFNIAITPEGTRSRVERWKSGFYRIAMGAGIPIDLARIDHKRRNIGIFKTFFPTGDFEADLREIKSYYSADMALYPSKYAE